MQLDDTATLLSQADFFDICDAEQRRLLAFASERLSVGPGETLYKSGEAPQGAYVLISGRLTTHPRLGKPFDIAQPGAVVGAMALIVAKPRDLSVTVAAPSDLLFVPRSAFLKLVRQYPDLAQRAAQRIQRDLGAYLDAIQPAHRHMRKDVI